MIKQILLTKLRENMCSIIDKTLFTLKRADDFDNQYAVHGHAGCGCMAIIGQ